MAIMYLVFLGEFIRTLHFGVIVFATIKMGWESGLLFIFVWRPYSIVKGAIACDIFK